MAGSHLLYVKVFLSSEVLKAVRVYEHNPNHDIM